MVTVCQTCGDRGFSEALIYCDNCQAYAVHRYCLDILPATFEEYVVWFCVDCEPKVAESSTLQQALPATGFQSRLKKGSPVRKLKETNDIKKVKKNKKNKKKSKYDSGSLAISKLQSQSSPSLLPLENLEKDDTLRISFGADGASIDKEARHSEAKTHPLKTCTSSRSSDGDNANEEAESVNNGTSLVAINGDSSIGKEARPSEAQTHPLKTSTSSRRLDWDNEEAESVDNRTSLVAINGDSNIIEHNFLDPGLTELHEMYSHEAAESVKTKTSLASNQIPKLSYVPAQPIFEPIWRGSFHLYDENLVVGVVAHLSSIACLKVCETAKCLPEPLGLELLPRCDVWPKGFREWGPSEESIALYFFPNTESEVKIFDNLVDQMIGRDLGMRAVVQDVELLVFTSKKLPLHCWRFQEKFYLWGVFRAKQASDSTDVADGEEKNVMKALTWHSRSPISPLSDCGSSLFG